MRARSLVILGVAVGLLIATAWSAVITHQPGSAYFSDVSASSPHNEDIGFLVEYGVTQGTTPTTYTPAMSVTREQMASFLMRSTALDTAFSLVLWDLAYNNGYNFGYQAYSEGRITYDQYETYQSLLNWWVDLVEFEASRMGAPQRAGPAGGLLSAARTMAARSGADSSQR